MSLDRPQAPDPYARMPKVPPFTLTSTDITGGEPLDKDFSVDGANVSPQLSWSGFPAETKSFVVSCYDPDAPTPDGYWHWTLVDVPASVTSLERGAAVPDGAFELKSSGGTPGFEGAGPPEGDVPHRYFFVVHAVGEESLGVDDSVTPTVVAFNLAFKAIGRAVLVGTYQR
ncbi:YbhB/YbcL family Raf kinase inhibitor-like protein [Branchiibius sp. NY16-3462-2]|uniref:YbhB/YbcL family Raf kinase inhibitor-like protein n=1 Tax=Branchiibius sp. NY16-3462-2 TaxID=1807500 RepID=UPI000796B5CC|nr:YbhB/YbcL family Raf kinase inhibitor-like protein [Branchiibius sp. NY16-3462-2]KYH45014.1 PEBP family protein [Branchiibius sp. NY16-3462-2]